MLLSKQVLTCCTYSLFEKKHKKSTHIFVSAIIVLTMIVYKIYEGGMHEKEK